MPIYDFRCRSCQQVFDALVRIGEVPDCPGCGGKDLEKLISLPAVSTESSRKRSFAKARKRASKEHKEKQHAQAEYERNYIKDHS